MTHLEAKSLQAEFCRNSLDLILYMKLALLFKSKLICSLALTVISDFCLKTVSSKHLVLRSSKSIGCMLQNLRHGYAAYEFTDSPASDGRFIRQVVT